MNDIVKFTINEDKIESVEIIDEKGNSSISNVLAISKIEQKNLIKALEEKVDRISTIRKSLDKKIDNIIKARNIVMRSFGSIIIVSAILLLVQDFGFELSWLESIYKILPQTIISTAVIELVTYALTYKLYVNNNIEYNKYGLLLNSVEKDLEIAKEKEFNKKINVCEFDVSNRLIDKMNEKYSLSYGKLYDDVDYMAHRIKNKEDVKTKVEYTESIDEYINYDEKPKTIGTKRRK